jgi:hypothetical protein
MWRTLAVPIVVALMASQHSSGQSFSSGSNGSDGALSLGTPGNYDLSVLGKDPDRENVYHFTTINIGTGVELDAMGSKISGPIVFLAQGEVFIQGTIWMRGENGHNRTTVPEERRASVPGAGGYPGGAGGRASPLNIAALAGGGPGGGQAGDGGSTAPHGGMFSGNPFLVPLTGGSGGGGQKEATTFGPGGGAGGGAILIASSTLINILGGEIVAAGGASPQGGGAGSGGAIRLVAPLIQGDGTLDVREGSFEGGVPGTHGRIRLEAFQHAHEAFSYPGLNRATNLLEGSPTIPLVR